MHWEGRGPWRWCARVQEGEVDKVGAFEPCERNWLSHGGVLVPVVGGPSPGIPLADSGGCQPGAPPRLLSAPCPPFAFVYLVSRGLAWQSRNQRIDQEKQPG